MFTSIRNSIRNIATERAALDLPSTLTAVLVGGFITSYVATVFLFSYQTVGAVHIEADNQDARMQIETRFKEALRDGTLVDASPQSVTTSYVLGAELDDEDQMVCIENSYEIKPFESETVEGWNTLTETQTSYQNADCSGEGHSSAPLTMRFEGNGLLSVESVTSRQLTAEGGEVSFSDPNDSWSVSEAEGGKELSERLERLNNDPQPQRLIFKTKTHHWISDYGNPTLY